MAQNRRGVYVPVASWIDLFLVANVRCFVKCFGRTTLLEKKVETCLSHIKDSPFLQIQKQKKLQKEKKKHQCK
jgi:hypothetical protein